jgi:glycosyltransferase involved in cell wall biosynthesis
MVPLFVLLAAPLTKPLRVPVLLWYTHWNAGRSLRLAMPLVDVVLSVSSGSFPLATSKLHATGHAIDVARFTPSEEAPTEGPLRLLALGRTARWKGYDTMLRALELATERGLDAHLELRGPQLTRDEKAHRGELEAIVAASDLLRDRVRIEPPLARDEIPSRLRASDALLSATQPRESETLDKVVYEAGACGVPVIASNTALDKFLAGLPVELQFRARDPESLADTLLAFAAAGPAARRAAGAELRRRVVTAHSVESWADAVTEIVSAQTRE